MPSLRVAAGTQTPLAALVVALVYYLVIKYTKWQPNEERKGQFIPLLFACHQLNVACIMLHGLLMACAPYHANKLRRAACNIHRSETTLGTHVACNMRRLPGGFWPEETCARPQDDYSMQLTARAQSCNMHHAAPHRVRRTSSNRATDGMRLCAHADHRPAAGRSLQHAPHNVRHTTCQHVQGVACCTLYVACYAL